MLNNSDAAGVCVRSAMKGAAHGLHSRAPRLLARILRPPKLAATERGDDDDDDGRLARAYTVAEGAVDSLAKHTRRGKCGVMTEHVLRAARRACADVGGVLHGGEEEEEDEDEEEDGRRIRL